VLSVQSRRLRTGKLDPNTLLRYVFTRLGARDHRVLVGPKIGEDAAVIDLGSEVLVVHSDPITAASKLVGWLAIHVPSNDVAVTGARPRWISATVLLPEDSTEELLDEITKQMDEAARELGAAIVGGHTEVAPELRKPIVCCTVLGTCPKERFVPTSGARIGDLVVMTKSAAVEGTAILATDFENELLRKGVPRDVIERGKQFIKNVSVVKEALALAEHGLATSMHDPTEGGILGGLFEIAYASGVRIVVYRDRVPVAPETKIICEAMGLDPLKLISSGALLATIPREHVEKALETLRGIGIDAAVIGEVVEGFGVEVVERDGSRISIEEWIPDEIYRLYE